ncbi:hypothetical protein BDF22DRAFT_682398 [Syncephalis plumigaleata]|nr:hypothetical protein BDF22DRAFT_682398 [Syncephalis plumigaleata]
MTGIISRLVIVGSLLMLALLQIIQEHALQSNAMPMPLSFKSSTSSKSSGGGTSKFKLFGSSSSSSSSGSSSSTGSTVGSSGALGLLNKLTSKTSSKTTSSTDSKTSSSSDKKDQDTKPDDKKDQDKKTDLKLSAISLPPDSSSKGSSKGGTAIKGIAKLFKPSHKGSSELVNCHDAMNSKYSKDSVSMVGNNQELKITSKWSVINDGCRADGTLNGTKVSIKCKSGTAITSFLSIFKGAEKASFEHKKYKCSVS